MSTDTRTYTVPDISCDRCKRAIEDHVTPLDGAFTKPVAAAHLGEMLESRCGGPAPSSTWRSDCRRPTA